jgi:hypothetical protein
MLKKCVEYIKKFTCLDRFWAFVFAIVIFVYFISAIVFPIVHLRKALPLQSEWEDAFNDVCDCLETANLLELGPKRTALGKECIAKLNNSVFDEVGPIDKFFGNDNYRPPRYDDRADILNNITSQGGPIRRPSQETGEGSDYDPCDSAISYFRAGIAFCFISIIVNLFICPVSIGGYYLNEYIQNLPPLEQPAQIQSKPVQTQSKPVQTQSKPVQNQQGEIEMSFEESKISNQIEGARYLTNGSEIMVLDTMKKWIKCKIIDGDDIRNSIRVHYIGWSSKWDEWIDLKQQSYRIRPVT